MGVNNPINQINNKAYLKHKKAGTLAPALKYILNYCLQFAVNVKAVQIVKSGS